MELQHLRTYGPSSCSALSSTSNLALPSASAVSLTDVSPSLFVASVASVVDLDSGSEDKCKLHVRVDDKSGQHDNMTLKHCVESQQAELAVCQMSTSVESTQAIARNAN